MQKEAVIMSMPVKLNVIDQQVEPEDFEEIFSYLRDIDARFSTFNSKSETEKINRGEFLEHGFSVEMQKVLALSEQTKKDTNGFFDVFASGRFDPAGIVKGLAIFEASKKLIQKGFRNFYLEIAGDIQVHGLDEKGEKWRIGIENPFNIDEIIKVVNLSGQGVATSGTYINGKHIINPLSRQAADEIISITVIAPDVCEADRFATAAFAMGMAGIDFIEKQEGLEGYMVTKDQRAISTTGFEKYLIKE